MNDTDRINALEKLANVKIWEQALGRWHIQHDTLATPKVLRAETLREAIDLFLTTKARNSPLDAPIKLR